MAVAAACAGAGEKPAVATGPRFVYENKNMSSPKVYVLQPWITSLLVNYEQLDASENLLAGQVLRVLRDSTTPGQIGELQDAILQVSDGSYYIRVVITSRALQREENTHMQLRFSSLICRIIVLQKYTVCFREEARLEDCEFYIMVHQFIVLPMERQRLESSDGNQEPSVRQKIKELWLRSLTMRNAPSSEPSISQLIDAIGQNQLEVLKENAEECLDLRVHKEVQATVKDEVPVTQWEAERKKEKGEDVFMVPANTLVIPPEEEAFVCDASKADTSEAIPGKSSDGGMVPDELSAASQSSSYSTVLSESSEGSLENPWNRLPAISLTLNSSDEKTFQPNLLPKAQQDAAADSNTPNLLEPSSQDSAEGLPLGEPVQASSPSLLLCYGDSFPMETGATGGALEVEAASDAPCPPQELESSQAPVLALSPTIPILPSSCLKSPLKGLPHQEQPHQEQADSSGTAFPPATTKQGSACARTQGGEAVGTKRKLPVGDGQEQLALSGKQLPRDAPWDNGKDTGRNPEPMSTKGAKKSRKETELQDGKELEEEEEQEEAASPVSGPSSRLEQHRALQPYVKKPAQYRYKAPSPELCEQIRSIRISKAMLKWACWILTDREVDS